MDTPVYLDYAATAPLRPEARRTLLEVLDGAWGNPSSVHRWGRESRAILDDARARLARLIGASSAEIVFTRAGTEADNLAVLGRARTLPGAPVVCSAVEHKAVIAAVTEAGAPAVILPVDENGVIRMDALDEALAAGPAVVSVMWANNETGVVQPVAEIAERCAAAGVAFHSDAVPALGRLVVRADQVSAAMLSFSAHKVGGPKGIGALFVRRGTRIAPMVHGGGQERGLRPGTEDVAGALAFAAAAEAAEAERETSMRRLCVLRDRLEADLLERVPGLRVNGAGAERLANVSNLSVPGADPEMLLVALDLEGIAASSGSACSSGAVQPSHVLLAMGLTPELAGPSVRFSLGWATTEAEVERVLGVFPGLVERVRG